jgi:hypothetical protein
MVYISSAIDHVPQTRFCFLETLHTTKTFSAVESVLWSLHLVDTYITSNVEDMVLSESKI